MTKISAIHSWTIELHWWTFLPSTVSESITITLISTFTIKKLVMKGKIAYNIIIVQYNQHKISSYVTTLNVTHYFICKLFFISVHCQLLQNWLYGVLSVVLIIYYFNLSNMLSFKSLKRQKLTLLGNMFICP